MLSKNQKKAKRLIKKYEINIYDIVANDMYGNEEQSKIEGLENELIIRKILDLIE